MRELVLRYLALTPARYASLMVRRHGLPARVVASALGGAVLGASHWAGSWGWVSWFAFTPLWWALRGASPALGLSLGGVFGFTAWAVGLSWLFATVLICVPGSVFLGAAVYVLLLSLHATLFAALGLLARAGAAALRRWARWSPQAAFLGGSVPALVAVEGLWPRLFPFSLAEVQSWHLPLVQTADLAGGAPIAFLIGLSSAALGLTLRAEAGRRRGRPEVRRFTQGAALSAVVLVLSAEGYGLLRIRSVDREVAAAREAGRGLSVAVIQPSIPTGVWERPKEVAGAAESLTALTRRAAADGARLVVWPENVYWRPAYFERADRRFERPLTMAGAPMPPLTAADVPVPVETLLGTIARVRLPGGGTRLHYVGFLKRADGSYGGASGKRFPTPFGEFIPGGRWFPWLYTLTPELVRIRGTRQRPMRLADGTVLGVYICYDATVPAAPRDLVRAGAELLAELTSNAAFFDEVQLPRQSLRTSALRAVETRRFVLRAVSSGVSAVIDPAGRLAGSIPFGGKGVLRADVVALAGTTPAVRFGSAAYLAAAAWSAALLALGLLARALPESSPKP